MPRRNEFAGAINKGSKAVFGYGADVKLDKPLKYNVPCVEVHAIHRMPNGVRDCVSVYSLTAAKRLHAQLGKAIERAMRTCKTTSSN